jgi:hypothetical protein
MAPLTPQITLTATLQDQNGQPIPKAMLVITLCGYGPILPKIIGTSMYAAVGPVEYTLIDGTTDTGIKLWGNDVIDPSGTFYSIAIVDNKRNVVQCGMYQFTGAGTIDLSNAPQIVGPGNIIPPLQFVTQDLFAISNTVPTQQAATLDHIADVMGWSVNRPIPAMSPQGRSFLAPPGYLYTLSKSPYDGVLLGVYYNGVLQLPSIHYQMAQRTIALQFNTANGDNLYALYVASTLS